MHFKDIFMTRLPFPSLQVRLQSPYNLILALLLAGLSISCSKLPKFDVAHKAAQAPPYAYNWESLLRYKQAPEWFRDAKFGIYAHFGPYSAINAPDTSDWYSRNMYQKHHPAYAYHRQYFGSQKDFGYKDFIPRFSAEHFNAEEWAELFVKAGARFAGPVAIHADGFAMWNSQLTPWNATKHGPKRDIVKELELAIKAKELKFMSSFHHHWKWGWYPTAETDNDTSNPKYATLYGPTVNQRAWGTKKASGKIDPLLHDLYPPKEFSDEWLALVQEAMHLYQPDMLWFDNRMTLIPEETRIKMMANYYNAAQGWEREVVLSYKTPDLKPGSATIDLERSRMKNIHPTPWLTDTSIAKNSWGYAEPLQYYSVQRIARDLADIVSKNGCLLLNIAPKGDGTIPKAQQDILKTLGLWLNENGEAIYATRPWKIFGEGPTQTPDGHLADLHFSGYSEHDVRYTQSKDNKTLYAIAFKAKAKALHYFPALATLNIKHIEALASKETLSWHISDKHLQVWGEENVENTFPYVIKIHLK